MAQSFTAEAKPLIKDKPKRRKVLVTGAAGNIGSYFAQHSGKKYDLRLMVREDEEAKDIETIKKFGEIVTGDVTNLERMKQLCEGIDTVVHMAGDASPNADWNSALNVNIAGTFNTFAAAKFAKCRRVIFASSIHAISGYPKDVQVKTSDPVNPGDLYGVSKCFGEALARYMAEQEGLSAIVLRIGAFQPIEAAKEKSGLGMLDAFVSQRDLNQLLERSIDAENLRFGIFAGLSDNRFKRMDITDARELLGYAPQDDLTEVNVALKKLKLDETVQAHNLSDDRQKSGLRNEVGKPTKPQRGKAAK
ncbi:MAG TPA: NAD(P)-dependent oxidoreductase [Tepidisphaeraceae bacterium]|jgi:nucleoside-diphosphate-sugar epimerase|nr:NAD(P)-dependent oxidoreductase [Tepidisphaeraceae bacterium]